MVGEMTLTQEDLDYWVDNICASGWVGYKKLSFRNKANRDAVYFAAKKRGAGLRRSSMRGQSVDPRYTVEGSHLPDLGLENERILTDLYILDREL